MSKADNMLSILWLLKSGKRRTARQLAEELEINIRTVYRYIDALCASGVPIIADAGHNGGYSLPRSFNGSPLFFDLEEQKALVHAAAFAREAGYPYGDALERAVTKLKRYASEEQLSELARHETGLEVIHPPAYAEQEPLLQTLEAAVADRCTLRIDYRKSYGSTVETRDVEPYGLVHWRSKWYVVGYCRLREDIRNFRVDRICGITRTDGRFERPQDFSPRDVLLRNLLPDPEAAEGLIEVRVQGRASAIDDLCTNWLLGHAVAARSETEVVFRLEEEYVMHHLPYTLMSYGGSVSVLEPAGLKESMVEIAARLLDYYKSM